MKEGVLRFKWKNVGKRLIAVQRNEDNVITKIVPVLLRRRYKGTTLADLALRGLVVYSKCPFNEVLIHDRCPTLSDAILNSASLVLEAMIRDQQKDWDKGLNWQLEYRGSQCLGQKKRSRK